MSKSFEKHLAAIKAGRIEKTNVIGLRKAFNAYDRASRGYSVRQPVISDREFQDANEAINDHHPTVAGELHDSGLKVLRNPRYAGRWNERQQGIIDRFDHFRLVRFDWIGPRQAHCVPVYRVVDKVGQSFLFRNIPWQSAWSLGEEDGPRVIS